MGAAKRSIVIDCDPGQDDAVNLLLALAVPETLQIRGITTVAGNVPLAKTERNARLIVELAERPDVFVYAGCEAPLIRSLVTAEYVHGREGIDGIELFEPAASRRPEHAVDFLVETLMGAGEAEVTLVPTGPLTNVAAALVKAPSIASRIREIVLMGGAAREGGNVTPSAEFNIYVDPHAAHVVLGCGRPIVMMGLDVTHQVIASRSRTRALEERGGACASAVARMLEFSGRYDALKYGMEGGPLHDPCTVAYLLEPGLFRTKRVNVAVETSSELTMGETVVDLWNVSGREANVEWAESVDAEGFFELVAATIARLP